MDLNPKSQVTGVSQSGNNITLGSKFIVNSAAPYTAIGFTAEYIFYTYSAGYGRYHMNFRRMSFLAQELDGFYQG